MTRRPDRTLILSLAGCGAAAIFFTVTLARALTVDAERSVEAAAAAARPPARESAIPEPSGTDDSRAPVETVPLLREGEGAPSDAPDRPLSMDALLLAVENDPFQESRQRPPERYRMPGDPIESAGPPPPPPPPPFQVLGIAQMADGGLAVMQIEDAPPRVLSVGESLFGYTLERVEGEVATMTGQGRTLNLTVAQAAPKPPPEEAERESRDRRGRNARDAIERVRQRGEGEAVRNLERQLRGAEQGAIEAIRRMIEQRGNTMEAFPSRDGRVILRPRVRADTNTTAIPRAPSGR